MCVIEYILNVNAANILRMCTRVLYEFECVKTSKEQPLLLHRRSNLMRTSKRHEYFPSSSPSYCSPGANMEEEYRKS